MFDERMCIYINMNKIKRPIWTQPEIKLLIQNYPKYGAKYCINKLGCSRNRVWIKAFRLKLKYIRPEKSDTKICTICLKKKSLLEFSPHTTAYLGVNSQCKICRAKHESYRKRTDQNYRLIHGIRNRIRIAIKKNVKHGKSLELLGCSIPFLKEYIQKQFKPGMTWENHGHTTWHLDHIKPCNSFDLSKPEAQRVCFHYTNLQPLWARDNLSKSKSV